MTKSLPLLPFVLVLSGFVPGTGAQESAPTAALVEKRRHPAAEAFQGVAVDAEHFYAITNRAIGKYRKDTGARVACWEGDSQGPVQHLNSGIVHEGKLFVAHSNFPKMPEESSLEVWEVDRLRFLERHVFPSPPGSLTWIVPEGEGWLACFAHYRKTSDPAKTRLLRYDGEWKVQASWAFPTALVERFGNASSSGGALGPDGKLYITGHDAREVYVLRLPEGPDGQLVWEATLAIATAGQAFAWDPSNPRLLYSIERKTREVVVSELTPLSPK